jgi:L-iditol 2-dehydrogenase
MIQYRITAPYIFAREEVPVPEIAGDEVLLKIDAIGVCGSDMQIYHGKHKFMTFPVILGHEIAATVQKAGTTVEGYKPGDKVTVEPQVYCGECYPCKTGRFNVCEKLRVMGVHQDGCAREYVAVNVKYLHSVPHDMAPELAALVEPFAVGVGAVRRSRNLAGANVTVVGAGPIGNFTAQAAKALGAGQVMITDIQQGKLDYAAECGVDHCVNTAGISLKDAVIQRFGAQKADIIIDCAALPFTFKAILEAARPSSEIIITGNFKEPVEFNVPILQRQEITLLGHMMYVRKDYAAAIDLLSHGKIHTAKTVTKTFDFKHEYEAAFKYADDEAATVMKLILRV